MSGLSGDSDLVSIISEEMNDKATYDATETFLDAALTGDINLLTSLYESGTEVI